MVPQLLDLVLKAGVAALLLAALVVLFAKAPRASITLTLVLAVLEGSREWPVALGVSLASININWADVATAIMGGIAVLRLAWRHIDSPARAGILGMAAMIGIGLISWTLIEGLQPAVNAWRPWTLAVAAALFAACSPRLQESGGLRPFVWAAALASLMQAVGIARRGFGSNEDTVIVNGDLVGARPISAAAALIILIGLVVLLLDGRQLGVAKVALAAWLGVSVVVAQHRSVWVAAAVAGLLLLLALVVKSRHRLVVGTLAGIGAFAVGTAVAAIVRTQGTLSVSASSTGTLEWRLENWTEKLTAARSGMQWLVGQVFGPTPLSDPVSTVVFRVSSHSMYVETVAVLGLVGLVLLFLIIVGAIRATQVATAERVVVLTLLAFGIFYQWPAVAWLAVGVSVAPTALAPENTGTGDSPAPVAVRRSAQVGGGR